MSEGACNYNTYQKRCDEMTTTVDVAGCGTYQSTFQYPTCPGTCSGGCSNADGSTDSGSESGGDVTTSKPWWMAAPHLVHNV